MMEDKKRDVTGFLTAYMTVVWLLSALCLRRHTREFAVLLYPFLLFLVLIAIIGVLISMKRITVKKWAYWSALITAIVTPVFPLAHADI